MFFPYSLRVDFSAFVECNAALLLVHRYVNLAVARAVTSPVVPGNLETYCPGGR